jgi:hypothetical protein
VEKVELDITDFGDESVLTLTDIHVEEVPDEIIDVDG